MCSSWATSCSAGPPAGPMRTTSPSTRRSATERGRCARGTAARRSRSPMTRRLGLGVFGMQSVPQRPDHQVKLYRDLLEDAELAEALGFEGIWLSEHHFWFDGYCPADIAAAGAILGRTKRLGVGTGVMLLP